MLLRKNRYSITILTIILSLTCLSLSFWQFKRLNWKKNLIENLDLAYESSPANIKEFIQLVQDVRAAEKVLGSKEKRISYKEKKIS